MKAGTPTFARLVPAGDLLEPTNAHLLKAGIRNMAELHNLLEKRICEIPEVRRLSEVCERHDAIGVLSGGTASMVIAAAIESAGQVNPPRLRSLNDMGSDIDALVMSKRNDELRPGLGVKIAAELNDSSSLILHPSVPSSLRRRVVLEWDVNEVDAFARAIENYGGDPLSQLGIGLSGGKLYLFDPHGGLYDFLEGRLRWVPPATNPYDSPLYEGLQYDPALEGLRMIRMIGRFKSAGVMPTKETLDELASFGDSAIRKSLVSKALASASDDSGDFKLRRRWEKYVTRVWADTADIGESLTLMNDNHYTQLLQQLGMSNLVLHPLENRPFTSFSKSPPPGVVLGSSLTAPYLWLSSRMLKQFTEGAVFGTTTAGAPGLACQGSLFEGKGYGSVLTRVHVKEGAAFLDLRSDAGKALLAQASETLGVTDAEYGEQLRRVQVELGLAGVLTGGDPADITITTATAVKRFEVSNLDFAEVLNELPRTEQDKVGLALRVAIALGRQSAADDLTQRVVDGRVSIDQLLHPFSVDALLAAPIQPAKLLAAIEAKATSPGFGAAGELERLQNGWAAITQTRRITEGTPSAESAQ